MSVDADNARFVAETGLAAEFARLCEPVLAELDLRLVRVALMGRENATVQIMAEHADGTISINECAQVSRALSPLLDAHDPIPGGYVLEVSSPGIARPLVRPSDFEDWAGYNAKIELRELLDGRKRFKGILEGFEDGEIRLEVDLDGIGHKVIGLPVGLVAEARLVISDALIREALNRSKAHEAKTSEAANDSDTSALDGAEIADINGDGASLGAEIELEVDKGS